MVSGDYYLDKINTNQDTKIQQKKLGKLKKDILYEVKKGKELNYFYPSEKYLSEGEFKILPKNSVLIKVSFILKKSYTSKDEGEFHLLEWEEKGKKEDERQLDKTDNPIVRDKFLGCPMVRPSSWKGHLRFAAERVEQWEECKRTKIIKRLFGSENTESEEKDLLKGRLYFFPTFFYKESERGVIAPLSRATRTPASGPINIEIMGKGKKGEFYLLYFSYPCNNEAKEMEIKEDLNFLIEALALMFYTYGFSAKKTSGFGVIEKELDEGKIWLKSKLKVLHTGFNTLDELKIKVNEL